MEKLKEIEKIKEEEIKINYVAITGASSGIGYDVAKVFAKRNKNLILIARRKDNLEKLKEEVLQISPLLDVVIKIADLSITENVYNLYESLQKYHIDTWINNAGFGNYESIAEQSIEKTLNMLRLNVEAVTILSSLYVRDFRDVKGAQLINISSAGGYIIVPKAVTYCATKFFVNVFTEGLARELQEVNAKLQVKILAPAATKTEFGKVATNVAVYDYDKLFNNYHTSVQMAEFLLELYDSDKTVGVVDRESFIFRLTSPQFAYAGNSIHNQKI